jgi:hypothetical protein
MSNLASRIKKLEAVQPPEPSIIRLVVDLGEPLTEEEQAVLLAEEQRRLAEALPSVTVCCVWSKEEAARLGVPARKTETAPRSRLVVELPDGSEVVET